MYVCYYSVLTPSQLQFACVRCDDLHSSVAPQQESKLNYRGSFSALSFTNWLWYRRPWEGQGKEPGGCRVAQHGRKASDG